MKGGFGRGGGEANGGIRSTGCGIKGYKLSFSPFFPRLLCFSFTEERLETISFGKLRLTLLSLPHPQFGFYPQTQSSFSARLKRFDKFKNGGLHLATTFSS